jgi:hypothetical protein
MTTYEAQTIAALEKAVETALFHESCLDSTVSESMRNDHKRHVASKRRALKKAIKGAAQ